LKAIIGGDGEAVAFDLVDDGCIYWLRWALKLNDQMMTALRGAFEQFGDDDIAFNNLLVRGNVCKRSAIPGIRGAQQSSEPA
jgi:hypothetical protein